MIVSKKNAVCGIEKLPCFRLRKFCLNQLNVLYSKLTLS